jgi:hypothetical protein
MIVTYNVIQDSNYLTFDMVANMLHHIQRVFHHDADTISSPSNMDGQMGCKSYYEKMGWVMEIYADLIIGPKTMKNQIVIENTSRQRRSKHFVQNRLKSTTVLATRRHNHADSSTKPWPIRTQMSCDNRSPTNRRNKHYWHHTIIITYRVNWQHPSPCYAQTTHQIQH